MTRDGRIRNRGDCLFDQPPPPGAPIPRAQRLDSLAAVQYPGRATRSTKRLSLLSLLPDSSRSQVASRRARRGADDLRRPGAAVMPSRSAEAPTGWIWRLVSIGAAPPCYRHYILYRPVLQGHSNTNLVAVRAAKSSVPNSKPSCVGGLAKSLRCGPDRKSKMILQSKPRM